MAEILHFEILRKHGQTHRQTHRQTDMGITIPRPPPMGGEVKIYIQQKGYTICSISKSCLCSLNHSSVDLFNGKILCTSRTCSRTTTSIYNNYYEHYHLLYSTNIFATKLCCATLCCRLPLAWICVMGFPTIIMILPSLFVY